MDQADMILWTIPEHDNVAMDRDKSMSWGSLGRGKLVHLRQSKVSQIYSPKRVPVGNQTSMLLAHPPSSLPSYFAFRLRGAQVLASSSST
jgi:hypothetical protein